ncbi:MAG: hypothetical protein GWO02_13580 [Gammaproteobacteria bacterium]|nr:hypothetical protein [Gammaproteobacteria bacterium]
MRSIKTMLLCVGVMVLGACAAETGDVGSSSAEARNQICPAIAILCAPGYRVKQLANCDQICVPDNGQQHECETDLDCGAIYCITTPCPQPVCRGHQCVLPNAPPSNEPGGVAEPCGDITCGQGSYCCNSSCGICAPDGGACIQIACADGTTL